PWRSCPTVHARRSRRCRASRWPRSGSHASSPGCFPAPGARQRRAGATGPRRWRSSACAPGSPGALPGRWRPAACGCRWVRRGRAGRRFASTPDRCLDRSHVDLAHGHHGVERALGHGGVGAGECFGQHPRRDLPRQAPAVLAPAAFALLAAIADDGVPVAVGLRLVVGRDLERERLALLEHRPSVQADAGDAQHGELDGEHVAGLAAGEIARRAMHRVHGAVGKGPGIEGGGAERVVVVPQADRVLRDHLAAPGGSCAIRISRPIGYCWRMAELDPTKPTASRARIETIVRRARGSLPAALVRRFIDAELLSQSAALALYAILSLAPLLLILVWLTSAIMPGARESLMQQVAQLGGT